MTLTIPSFIKKLPKFIIKLSGELDIPFSIMVLKIVTTEIAFYMFEFIFLIYFLNVQSPTKLFAFHFMLIL